jgi:hypothetical protein
MDKLDRAYCTCGAYWRGRLSEKGQAALKAYWLKNHSRPGHAPCDQQTAAYARTKLEKMRMAEGR